MFTGIVEEVGTVAGITRHDGGAALVISCHEVLDDLGTGGSVAVDGCCLTATALTPDQFSADLSAETLRVTALGALDVGAGVNLERPLRTDGRLGGHLVLGHVDAVGSVMARDRDGVMTLSSPPEVAPYLVPKGSVTVQGVSLTVVDVGDDHFTVAVIPHTFAVTTLATLGPGARVNLEADIIAKYVQRLLRAGEASPYAAVEGVAP
jgi:riboflavin synthase